MFTWKEILEKHKNNMHAGEYEFVTSINKHKDALLMLAKTENGLAIHIYRLDNSKKFGFRRAGLLVDPAPEYWVDPQIHVMEEEAMRRIEDFSAKTRKEYEERAATVKEMRNALYDVVQEEFKRRERSIYAGRPEISVDEYDKLKRRNPLYD